MSGGSVADATGNWVDSFAPARRGPTCGSPASTGRSDPGCCCCRAGGRRRWRRFTPDGWRPDPRHLVLFLIGAFAMRGAGCTWNDIVDRDLDAQVERTRSRPIPSGQVSPRAAAAFLVAQALIGLAVLACFNRFAVLAGIASLVIVAVYPFMKRITYWPQIVLGLAFSWGALMGWAAAVRPARCAGDRALCRLDRLGDRLRHHLRAPGPRGRRADRHQVDGAFVRRTDKPVLAIFYVLATALIGIAGWLAGAGALFALGLAAFAGHLGWQIRRLDIADGVSCLKVFKSNRDAGLILFAALVADAARCVS